MHPLPYEARMVTIHSAKISPKWCMSWPIKALPPVTSTSSFIFAAYGVPPRQSLFIGSSSILEEFRCSFRQMNRKIPSAPINKGLPTCAMVDEDYRSSRNIAISLFRRYRNVIDRGGTENLKEFINVGVNAYALGCTDEGLRKELMYLKESGDDIDELREKGGGTSLKRKIISDEVHECILWLSIIFITILCAPPPTVIRWSTMTPVSDEVMARWKGFCALIANAYFVKGMAWLPVRTLQLEQLAVLGTSEEPSVVANRMQLVFTTLEVISPQWPKA